MILFSNVNSYLLNWNIYITIDNVLYNFNLKKKKHFFNFIIYKISEIWVSYKILAIFGSKFKIKYKQFQHNSNIRTHSTKGSRCFRFHSFRFSWRIFWQMIFLCKFLRFRIATHFQPLGFNALTWRILSTVWLVSKVCFTIRETFH